MFSVRDQLAAELDEIRDAGLFKAERVIRSPQQANVRVGNGEVLNLCANNYLGLAGHPALIEAAQEALDRWGFGMASVRFICGTQEIHKELEAKISSFLGTEDTILYGSCFDANGGLFETLLGPEDAVISDALNHASIIDGIRLCKAQRHRYANSDMDELESLLKQTAGARRRLIATDGVFSMDGYVAKLDEICDLAERYDAMVMVDDSHAVGFVGDNGRGTPEYFGVEDEVDLHGGTFAKSFGTFGGYMCGPKTVIDFMRFQSQGYVLTKALPAAITAATIKTLELLQRMPERRKKLWENLDMLRAGLRAAGLNIGNPRGAVTAVWAKGMRALPTVHELEHRYGILANLVLYPAVPINTSIVRITVSAMHTREDIQRVIDAFAEIHARNPLQDGEPVDISTAPADNLA